MAGGLGAEELAERIAGLGRSGAFAAVGELLGEADDETVCAVVEGDLEKLSGGGGGGGSGGTVVQYVLKGASALAERGRAAASDRVLAAASAACVGRICEESPGAEREGSDGPGWAAVGDRLLEVLPRLGARSVIDIAFRVLAELKAGGSVAPALGGFLPMLLDTLGTVGPVELTCQDWPGADGGGGGGGGADASVTRTGAALKAYWVESACAYKWDPRSSVRICAVLRELVLAERLVGVVANRVLRQLRLVELEELPAMVYQLLLLARRGRKREIVGGVFAFFDGLEAALPFNAAESSADDRRRWRELGDVEGTVMLHINYSIKQDFELGDALVAYAKERCEAAPTAGAPQALSPFSFACLLALARIHRFEDAVTGLLRTLIVRGAHDQAMAARTAWLRAHVAGTAGDAQGLLAAVVVRSSYGWDQVTQSLTQLCLGVIDSVAARRSAYSPAACAQARGMCTATLQAAFSTHEFVRGEIVDQILSRAMFQTDSHVHFLELLQRLVDDDPDGLRAYTPRFIDALDSISVMSHQTIERLLRAVSTVFLEDAQFRSSLVLVLRKILFAHGMDERRIALSGLFVLIECSARALDACHRQTAAAAAAATDAAAARRLQGQATAQLSVLLELMGLLRRCLTQQPEIRTASYQRLGALLDLAFVRRCAPLLSALHGIFEVEVAKHYQRDRAVESPVNVHACISPSTHKVTMPVAHLLQCYAKLATAQAALPSGAAQAGGSGVGGDLWADLCARFAKAQMEDYELDPTGDYGLGTPAGLRSYNTARLVLGCVDAALEYALASCICGSGGVDEPAVAMELFSRFMRFGDVLCSRCLDDRKKRLVAAPSDLSQMSLPAALAVLELVLPDRLRADRADHPLNADSAAGHAWYVAATAKAALWAANAMFVRHLLEVALARATGRASAGPGGSPGIPLPEPEARVVRKLAYVAFSGVISYYAAARPDVDVELPPSLRPRAGRGRSVVHLSADVLAACAAALSPHPAALDRLFAALARPAPALFAADGEDAALPPAHAAQCGATLLAGLRNAVGALLAAKPVAAKESTALLAAAHVVADRLAELDAACAAAGDSDARGQIRACLGATARWAFGLVGGEIPGDAALLRAIAALLVACQPGLQPEAPAAADPAASRAADAGELGLLSRLVGSACRASRLLAGDADESDGGDDDDEPNLAVFTQRTVPVVVGVAVQWLKGELRQVDWATGQLRRSVLAELAERAEDEDLATSIGVERRICIRVAALARILMQLLGAQLPAASAASDQVVRALQELHRSFGLLTRAKLALPDLPVTEAYIDALSLICSDLNAYAYTVIIERYSSVGDDLPPPSAAAAASMAKPDAKGKAPLGGKKGKGAAASKPAKAKVMRNSALVSSLVYQMELTEKHVIRLAAKLKTPLAHYLKRSTARDFRIEAAAVPAPAVFGRFDTPAEEDEEDDDEDVPMADDPDDPETEIIDDAVVGLPDPDSSDGAMSDDDGNTSSKRVRRR